MPPPRVSSPTQNHPYPTKEEYYTINQNWKITHKPETELRIQENRPFDRLDGRGVRRRLGRTYQRIPAPLQASPIGMKLQPFREEHRGQWRWGHWNEAKCFCILCPHTPWRCRATQPRHQRTSHAPIPPTPPAPRLDSGDFGPSSCSGMVGVAVEEWWSSQCFSLAQPLQLHWAASKQPFWTRPRSTLTAQLQSSKLDFCVCYTRIKQAHLPPSLSLSNFTGEGEIGRFVWWWFKL